MRRQWVNDDQYQLSCILWFRLREIFDGFKIIHFIIWESIFLNLGTAPAPHRTQACYQCKPVGKQNDTSAGFCVFHLCERVVRLDSRGFSFVRIIQPYLPMCLLDVAGHSRVSVYVILCPVKIGNHLWEIPLGNPLDKPRTRSWCHDSPFRRFSNTYAIFQSSSGKFPLSCIFHFQIRFFPHRLVYQRMVSEDPFQWLVLTSYVSLLM